MALLCEKTRLQRRLVGLWSFGFLGSNAASGLLKPTSPPHGLQTLHPSSASAVLALLRVALDDIAQGMDSDFDGLVHFVAVGLDVFFFAGEAADTQEQSGDAALVDGAEHEEGVALHLGGQDARSAPSLPEGFVLRAQGQAAAIFEEEGVFGVDDAELSVASQGLGALGEL